MELFKDLGLKEICGIIGTLGKNTSIQNIQNVIEVDGKKFYYEKDGNLLTIYGPDRSSCSIYINYFIGEQKRDDRKAIFIKHHVDIKQKSKEGNIIRMKNDFSLNPGYESFENIERHDLMKGLDLQYNDEADFNLGLSRIDLKRNNQRYEFTSIGIKYGKKELLIDGDDIISEEPIRVEDLKGLKEALLIRNSIENDVKNASINKEVLDHIDRDFRAITRQQISHNKEK